MVNIISSEFYKIFRSKIFYFISTILLIMNGIALVAASIYAQKSSSFSAETNQQMVGTGISSYQGSYSGDLIFYIILIFVACMITAEYSNGSIQQMVSRGIDRWKLVIGQYVAISSAVTLVLIVFGVFNLLIDTVLYQLGEVSISKFILMNIGIISMFWAISGIGTFLSYLFKGGGIAIAISVLFVISSNFISQFLVVLTKNNVFLEYSLSNMRRVIIDFTSKSEDVVFISIIFLLIGIVTVLGSSLLFWRRDID